MLRTLDDTLVDVVEAMLPPIPGEGLRVSGYAMDLPVRIDLEVHGDQIEILGDLPSWRWQTVFDRPPCRLRIICGDGGFR
jgi:hypothetical protein